MVRPSFAAFLSRIGRCLFCPSKVLFISPAACSCCPNSSRLRFVRNDLAQLSVLVAPEPGPAVTHEPARLQAGELVSFVWPRYPKPGDRYGLSETVKVRTTIGKLGQVQDIKLVSG